MLRKIIFLDRDGVVNKYYPNDYIKSIEEFSILDSFLNFWEKHREKYDFIIITNQAGINKGIVKYKFFINISKYLIDRFNLKAVYFCPHKEEENCPCRKPKNLLLKKAIQRFQADVENSYFIGDSYTDMLCAHSMNIKFILVLTGKTKIEETQTWDQKPFKIVENLSQLNL